MDYKLSEEEYKSIKEQYEAETAQALKKLDTDAWELIRSIDSRMDLYRFTDEICEDLKNKVINVPSDIFKGKYKSITEFYIPEQFKKAFLYSIDNMTKWQYSSSYMRRSVRTDDYAPHMENALNMIKDCREAGIYKCSIEDIVSGNMSEEMLEYSVRAQTYYTQFRLTNIIAAELDLGNEKLENVLSSIILGDNNTSALTSAMIRGIVRSSNSKLHKLLGDYLLAAKLQEGVRQAVCENMDCGTPEAFITLLDVIIKNDLIRYSSVKRAAATWTGIFDDQSMERISNKLLDTIYISLSDKKRREENLCSDDSIELYCALWAYGFYNVKTAAGNIRSILESGIKNRILVCSYYLRNIEWPSLERKTAKYAVENYGDDMEILACYMPCYMDGYTGIVYNAVCTMENGRRIENYKDRGHCDLTKVFDSTKEAQKHYNLLLGVLRNMKHKSIEFSPCIFPWYSTALKKTDLITRLCFLANALDDNDKCDEICTYIQEIDISNYGSRRQYILCLLTQPQTPVQRNMLIKLLSDREQYSRDTAFEIAKLLDLTADEYAAVEQMLRYRSSDIRSHVFTLLYKQNDNELSATVERLASGKTEELRTGALDIMLTLSKDKAREACFSKCCGYTGLIRNPTTKEKILIDEISSDISAADVLSEKGYGLYDPDKQYTPSKPDLTEEIKKYHEVFPAAAVGKNLKGSLTEKAAAVFSHTDTKLPDYYQCLVKLDNYIEEHKDTQFIEQYSGDAQLLGACNTLRRHSDDTLEGSIYLAEHWRKFYKKENLSFPLLVRMYVFLNAKSELKQTEFWDKQFRYLFGNDFFIYKSGFRYFRHIYTITSALFNEYCDKPLMLSISEVVMNYAVTQVPDDKMIYHYKSDYGYNYQTSLLSGSVFRLFTSYFSFDYALSQNCGKEVFDILYSLCIRYNLYNTSSYDIRSILLSYSDYLKAYTAGIIDENFLYKVFYELAGPSACLKEISSQYIKDNESYSEQYIKIRDQVFAKTTDIILGVELHRGDTQTPVSEYIYDIKRVFGVEKLAAILSALGKETLNRSQYFNVYYNSSRGRVVSKKDSLSHLLSVCAPNDDDNADKLRELIGSTDISEQRLIETAMYNSLWMNIIGEYLGWNGFKSACYYFIAHMNERFDNTTKAIIAKYTPLSEEELNGGAFDIKWFRQAYTELGQKRFDAVYKAAKYISDGSKHSRARKYADAVCGKFDIIKTREEIIKKRNKDTLMAYSLIPLSSEDDLTRRYEFLQQFLKESKQFGAQRRASEAAAVNIALSNLASNAGYADVTRLTMKMESKIVQNRAQQFEPVEIDDVSVRINIDMSGKPEIECIKNNRKLRSVPAKLKKNEYILTLKETQGILKNQYSRTKLMLEQSMEDAIAFTCGEITELSVNPVIRPLTENLVYKHNDVIGFLKDKCLVSFDGRKTVLADSDEIVIAHPLDLYRDGHWHEYQEYVFINRLSQPFKQIFRELYVKTQEELHLNKSLRYAGNQIQPKKTVACLKSRRWIADYENGLQKIYYKENIIACIYAMADWFSPSEIEAPTLEYVQFFDRKTFMPVEIDKVPDIIFSEVMRDVDLAVSVAHAGTVDPETSHSTVEMRIAIAQFTLEMFRLTNVTFEKNHAVIEGKKGRYSIHMGSGIIHQFGGTQINVLPVHSQHRGKLFLPFIDEDPKTAEIMSKIILFAEDTKIKDPFILSQIS
ncbi:MAG: DUF4132 domain-containing protein [Oscillospiraceae bacterium]|nr:DUF4132 domain-containing protein [Oscillospiraceae bacterium]